MTDTPRETTPRETLIAERAYDLWEAEGRPHGRDREHWSRAEAEIGPGETAPGAAAMPERYAPGQRAEEAPAPTDALAREGEGERGPEPGAEAGSAARPRRAGDDAGREPA